MSDVRFSLPPGSWVFGSTINGSTINNNQQASSIKQNKQALSFKMEKGKIMETCGFRVK